MWAPCRKDTFLFTLELRWSNLALLIVVVFEADVKDEDDPDVAETIKTFQT